MPANDWTLDNRGQFIAGMAHSYDLDIVIFDIENAVRHPRRIGSGSILLY